MSNRPLLSFVVPVRNDATRLLNCIRSIEANVAPPPYEVVVVDNGSTDDSVLVAKRSGATVLSLPGVKVSALRNAGAAAAKGEVLAFVDADHLLDSRWMSSAAEILENAGVSGAGAPCSTPSDANWVQWTYGLLRPLVKGQEPTEWLGSGNLALRKEAFVAVGGFDTSLESCEDVDLCNRLVKAGYRLVSDERMRNVHLGDPRTLKALFFGELWRGRDNLRVTLRGPLTISALPSIVIPLVDLVCLCCLPLAPLLGAVGTIAPLGVIGCLSALRAVRMQARNPKSTLRSLGRAFIVALVYDSARAFALVARATHRTRRESSGEAVVVQRPTENS